MAEYIDRWAVASAMCKACPTACSVKADPCALLDVVLKAPGIEVVRCKDCVYFLDKKLLCTHEGNRVFGTGKTTYGNCFCSYGERSGGND